MSGSPAASGSRDIAKTQDIARKDDVERLLADSEVPVERKIALLDARERELRGELLRGRTVPRAGERDEADAYHLLNDVLGALSHLRGGGTRGSAK